MHGAAAREDRALMKFGTPMAKTKTVITAKIMTNDLDIRANDA